MGVVYDSYNNGEKERAVCRPSRVDGIHDGFDKRKQSVKMADIFGIEKVWRGIYGSCCEHGDFLSLRSNHDFKFPCKILRIKESHSAVVERSQFC